MHRWANVGKMYYASKFSHKYDRTISLESDRARSDQLYSYYPWVKRQCQDNDCIEQLVLTTNEKTITKHIVAFEKYRTELVFNPNRQNRTCLL